MSRQLFLDAICRNNHSGRPALGTGTSIGCQDLMRHVGVSFPKAHLDAQAMAALALAGHTVLGLDVVMPLFSVCHEAAAMGCRVNWGGPSAMPESGPPIYKDESDIRVPADLPWDQADIAIPHPRSQWAEWGVKAANGTLKPDNFPASLLLPMGKDGPAFLAYENFTKAYLKWNESLVYSTTAAYLATRIAGAGRLSPGREEVRALSYDQIIELQKILAAKGYDVGKVDGKLGRATRFAVKDLQTKMGWPADSYPTVEFLAQLKQS